MRSCIKLYSFVFSILIAGGLGFATSAARGDTHTTGIPQLSSLPGAPYTLYLDFGGFNFTGTWGGSSGTQSPGNTAAFDNVTGSFGSTEQTRIKQVWSGVAQAYAPFDINVTTVDPAISGGSADTDAHRQAYYDKTAKLMHTVMTPTGGWEPGAGGVSWVGTTKNAYSTSGTNNNNGAGAGWHTNWDFADTSYDNFDASQPAIHENGHGLGLRHQSDYVGGTLINEYTVGDYTDNTNYRGNGTYDAIMGAGYYTQRSTWRLGDSDNGQSGHTQNDVAVILSDPGQQFVNDGVGHTLASATPLELTGSTINYDLAKGIITPSSSSSPAPIGAANYTSDYYSFRSDGSTPILFTVNDGTEFLSPGTADLGVTLRSTLTILNSGGAEVATGTEAALDA